jgi:hypothetical protein
MLDELKNVQGQGIRVEKDTAELRRQELEVLDRETQAQLAVAELNGRLRPLVGLTPQDTARIWPAADLKVIVEPVDQPAAVAQGLARRPDLCLLRTLIQSPDESSLDAGRSILASVTGMPAVSMAGSGLLDTSSRYEEMQTRHNQFSELLVQREGVAEEEIRQAACTVEARFRQIAIAKCQEDLCRERLKVLRLRREMPNTTVTTFDIGSAELQLLDAQRGLFHQVIALRVAQVKLKEAQGFLVLE